MPQWIWKAALAASAAVWGGSFVVLKGTIEQVSPSWMVAIRFALTALILAPALYPRLREHLDRSHLVCGVVLGIFYGAGYVIQTIALAHTTPGRNAFLTAVYCVMTPLINWVIAKKRPAAGTFVAALMCVLGVGFISLGDDFSFTLGLGEWLSLGCAVAYALHIVFVARFSKDHDILTLTVVQVAVTSLFALVVAIPTEQPPAIETFFEPDFLASLAYLVLLSSCFGALAQNVGQSMVEPAQASLILSLESVFAVVFSVIFYGELITPPLLAGFACIFAAVLVSEVVPGLRHAVTRSPSRGQAFRRLHNAMRYKDLT